MNINKLHPILLDELTFTTRALEDLGVDEERELPIIVSWRPTRSSRISALEAAAPDLRVERELRLGTAGAATRSQIEALSESDDVEMIWFDEPVYAMLDVTVPLLNIPTIWQAGNEGEGITVCVVDTGIDPNHPDFAGRLIAAEDFTGEGTGDGHGHGTHVASIVGGSGAASNGQYRGVAPKAKLLSAKVLRSDGSGRMSLVIAGLEWALDQGAQIINLSLGSRGNCNGSDATSVACDAAVEEGAIVIVAAGNEGPESNTVGSPGCAKSVITIGASTDQDTIANFSSRGPTQDGRIKPDVVLPGVGIIAGRASGTNLGQPLNEYYTSVNGTSMACPHAAGIAALMLELNPNLTHAEIKNIFMDAVNSLGLDPNEQGKGRLLALEAIEQARQLIPEPEEPQPEEPQPEEPAPPKPQPQTPRPQVPISNPSPQPDGCLGSLMRMFGML